jgi:hypothetical protein
VTHVVRANCIYTKGDFIFKKDIYLEEHQLIHRKGFISLAINYLALRIRRV